MRQFSYERSDSIRSALISLKNRKNAGDVSYIAGGTTIYDLMKLGISRPSHLIDITALSDPGLRAIKRTSDHLRIGALVTMAELGADTSIQGDLPVLIEALTSAASGQIRNVATLGGNVLQRTRCSYFRDTSYVQCNKRIPGSGCAARDGMNRNHAVLGTSPSCIATYAGDWAQALIALDAVVETHGPDGVRAFPFASLHRLPENSPHLETTLQTGELITGFSLPKRKWPRSRFVKIRDRASYAFANASAAVALDLADGVVRDVRIGIGGVASIPWRANNAERLLRGTLLTEEVAFAAAQSEFGQAATSQHNAFKIPLGISTVVRALLEARDMEIAE